MRVVFVLLVHLSSGNDPLVEFHRWKANHRVLDTQEIKSAPYVRLSHPFIARLIGTVRREYRDIDPFWNASDLDTSFRGNVRATPE